MASRKKNANPEFSPTSPGDDSDAILSPTAEIEPEPVPGLNGVPVRCTCFLYNGIMVAYRTLKLFLYFVNLTSNFFFFFPTGYDVCPNLIKLFLSNS